MLNDEKKTESKKPGFAKTIGVRRSQEQVQAPMHCPRHVGTRTASECWVGTRTNSREALFMEVDTAEEEYYGTKLTRFVESDTIRSTVYMRYRYK